ncbi:cytochrome c family protein [Dechloromonas sp. XY25]|uniref:Cytochrome c family protein n=1 Tax=Dechloromonas hankyongensis TaxID=2908002 RepID=A0ABS9K119_9RHOO|nr:cytochrome c family protein [Dechloromonas hankyongensis]MCG2576854.1 cytochrome c family protein [Dechloromonas hankyongensis]
MGTIRSLGWLLLGATLAGSAAADTSAAAYARGALVYERCAACHALDTDRTGPRHCGLFGRRAGSVPGFAYSPAMRRAGWVWNEKTLDRFLRSPLTVVPGTSMGYDGVKDDGERRDLIVFLREAGGAARCQNLPAGAGRLP